MSSTAKPPSSNFDAIILGAGGAGLMCAATAGQGGKTIAVLDHADAPGKKILISGGGRCNFTNRTVTAANYISANPHFAKSALQRYRPDDFIALVEKHGIAWHEKTLGQLFCDDSARQIVDMLLSECEQSGRTGGRVEISTGMTIAEVEHLEGRFVVRLEDGRRYAAPALVIATGGPSIPKLGATGFAYDLARKFGLKVVEPRPALVPLKLGPEEALFRELSGVSAPVEARCGKASFREAALFTHKGLSGPAILQISSYWAPGGEIRIDLLPSRDPDWLVEFKRNHPRQQLTRALASALPDRLAHALAAKCLAAADQNSDLANLPDQRLRQIAARLSDWPFRPSGTEGFAKAEVTLGGISTGELSSKTLESSRLPGLYFIGECVDVTGWLGGYNFQWAWASGVVAAKAIAARQ